MKDTETTNQQPLEIETRDESAEIQGEMKEFNLRDAVIYSAILNGEWKDC